MTEAVDRRVLVQVTKALTGEDANMVKMFTATPDQVFAVMMDGRGVSLPVVSLTTEDLEEEEGEA